MNTINLMTTFILFFNVSMISILVPRGPIENRDFKSIKGIVYCGFNIFIIVLSLSSLLVCYFLLVEVSWAFIAALTQGFLFLLIYLLDLAKIFPKSPTPMSKELMLIEIINAMLASLLIIFSLYGVNYL